MYVSLYLRVYRHGLLFSLCVCLCVRLCVCLSVFRGKVSLSGCRLEILRRQPGLSLTRERERERATQLGVPGQDIYGILSCELTDSAFILRNLERHSAGLARVRYGGGMGEGDQPGERWREEIGRDTGHESGRGEDIGQDNREEEGRVYWPRENNYTRRECGTGEDIGQERRGHGSGVDIGKVIIWV